MTIDLDQSPPNGFSVWESIRESAVENVRKEPMLASFLHATILNHDRFEDAVSFHLAGKLTRFRRTHGSQSLFRQTFLPYANVTRRSNAAWCHCCI